MSRNSIPIRMCVGCAGRAAQHGLLRIKVSASGALQLADRANNVGRSGYLHPETRCWTQFAARKGMVKSLGRSFTKEERVTFARLLEDAPPKSEVTGHVA